MGSDREVNTSRFMHSSGEVRVCDGYQGRTLISSTDDAKLLDTRDVWGDGSGEDRENMWQNGGFFTCKTLTHMESHV